MILGLNCGQSLLCYLCNYEPTNPLSENHFLLKIMSHSKESGDQIRVLQKKQKTKPIQCRNLKRYLKEKYKMFMLLTSKIMNGEHKLNHF